MLIKTKRPQRLIFATVLACLLFTGWLLAQVTPQVIVPSASPTQRIPTRTAAPQVRSLYPWKLNIVSTVFWVGEQPSQNNPVPNNVSSWDKAWEKNFGGYDDPDASNRIISHATGEFRPKKFIPKLNTFYIALPYNDKTMTGYRSEASRVVPWFNRVSKPRGGSSLKGRWVQIYCNNRSCYAQWEDVGPFVVDDWPYVFGSKRPVNNSNKGAGIDLSPAIRDYLGIPNSHAVHWRFVEDNQVPFGPWKKYGHQAAQPGVTSNDLAARKRYYEYLQKLRDDQYRRKTKSQLESGY